MIKFVQYLEFLLLVQGGWLCTAEAGELNRNAINTLYFGGDLTAIRDELLPLLESGQAFSKADSIFIYKNLSVVMAADPASKAKAQAYMYKLLVLAPSVDIIDMFVSDTIYMMFQNVKREYLTLQSYNQSKGTIENANEHDLPQPVPSDKPKAVKSESRWVFWTVGGVAVVGGIAAFFLMNQKTGTPERRTISNEGIP